MSEGCKYILVLIDAATRFCWLQAMSEITAAGVAQEMLHIFSEFGWPSTLVMDGGLNMSKAAVMNILALVGAEARVTIPGAQTNDKASSGEAHAQLLIQKTLLKERKKRNQQQFVG